MFNDIRPIEGFDPLIGFLMACLDDSTREWREELGEVAPEAVIWQPVPGSYSIGGLYLHLIDVESIWFERVTGVYTRDAEETKLLMSDETDVDNGIWAMPHAESIEWYDDLHKKVRARAREAVKHIDPAQDYTGSF